MYCNDVYNIGIPGIKAVTSAAAVEFDPEGTATLIKNMGPNTIYISNEDDVDTNDYPFAINETMVIESPIHMICASAETASLRTIQV